MPTLLAPGRFGDAAIIADSAGNVHVAAAGEGHNRGIWYFTNAEGRWARQQLTVPPAAESPAHRGTEVDGEPSIAIDADGSVWIAFTRWQCGECAPDPSDGTFYITNVAGPWSDPIPVGGRETHHPHIAVNDGHVRVAYDEGMTPGRDSYPLWYAIEKNDGWSARQVARDGGVVECLVANGRARLYYAPHPAYSTDEPLMVALEQPNGTFDTHEAAPNGGLPAIDSATGEVVAEAWSAFDVDADRTRLYFAEQSGGMWGQPGMLVDYADLKAFVLDGLGTIHVLAARDELDSPDELLYLSRVASADTFDLVSLAPAGGFVSAVTVDTAGRPSVVLATQTYEQPVSLDRGLWFIQRQR